MLILLLFFLSPLVRAGGTNCTFQCNDPVCKSVCHGACLAPQCIIQCESEKRFQDANRVCFRDQHDQGAFVVHRCPTSLNCAPPSCRTRCTADPPTDEEVNTMCPACETVCDPPVCVSSAGTCQPLCEAPQCGWQCRKPRDDECPPLICERQCELPSCEYSGATKLGMSVGCLLLTVGLFTTLV